MPTTLQLLGHATFKLTTPENNVVIIDPWLINNTFIPAGLEQQPRIDLMLITHGHEDHNDIHLPTIIAATSPTIIANNICRWHLLQQGVQAELFEPMNVGGTLFVKDVYVSMVHALHHAHIYVTDTSITMPHASNGFVVRTSDGTTIYFAGDTAVFGDMALIAKLYQPTIAVLPIADRSTMGATEAALAVELLGTPHIIPFHYGTFPGYAQTADEFLEKTRHSPSTMHILNAGDSLRCDEL